MRKLIRVCLLAAGLLLASGAVFAQSSSQAQHSPAVENTSSPGAGNAPLAVQTSAAPADRPVENADEEENAQFKYSLVVRAVARKIGISKEATYWIFMVINFAILAALLGWVVKKAMPNGFAPRTAEIQKGIAEARKASAEAGARLAEIEARLARLDAEIADIRTAAEADFSIEEQRIKAAAEQDASHVIASAEQEIAAAARSAQRELKAFVADLAVGLAEKKIKVDEATDQALVGGFAAQLGKDGN